MWLTATLVPTSSILHHEMWRCGESRDEPGWAKQECCPSSPSLGWNPGNAKNTLTLPCRMQELACTTRHNRFKAAYDVRWRRRVLSIGFWSSCGPTAYLGCLCFWSHCLCLLSLSNCFLCHIIAQLTRVLSSTYSLITGSISFRDMAWNRSKVSYLLHHGIYPYPGLARLRLPDSCSKACT